MASACGCCCINKGHPTHTQNHWVDMLSFLMDHNIWVDMCTEYSKSSGHQFHDIIIITDFILSRKAALLLS